MNYDNVNTCVAPMPINDCCESGTSLTMIYNRSGAHGDLHMIECNLDVFLGVRTIIKP